MSCPVCCDFCEHGANIKDEDGLYFGETWCFINSRVVTADYYCDEFECIYHGKEVQP